MALATTDVAALDAQAKRQGAATTGITRTRTDIKREAAAKAEALRGLVVELTTDEELRTALGQPVGTYFYGADAAFLTYCQQIAEAVPTLDKAELKDAGYDSQVLTVLTQDLDALTATDGAAVLLRTASAAVTDGLPPLFAAVDADLASLDRFMGFQALAQGDLVQQYAALRRLPKTPVHHVYRAHGSTPFDVPQLLFNILAENVPTPTLYNTGSRGHEVVFYLGAAASSRPRPGQGQVVANGKKLALADYTLLGDPATEPYLLVLQTSELGPGGWRVKG